MIENILPRFATSHQTLKREKKRKIKKRHQNKGRKFIKNKYFQTIGERNWVFARRISSNELFALKLHDEFTHADKYTKVKGNVSPYNGDLVYWSSRMGRNPEMPKRTASLLKKQKGKCNWCKLIFREDDVVNIDHIIAIAAGGRDEYNNLQLLHRHCHDKKTKSDLKVIEDYQRQERIEKLY